MNEVKRYLKDRKQEVQIHLNLLASLEKRSIEVKDPKDDLNVDIRQVLILKSSILVHLYNVIESTLTKSLQVIEEAVYNHHPKDYTNELFDVWIVHNICISNEISLSKLNERAKIVGRELLADSGWSKALIKNNNGNWDDLRTIKITKKLGIKVTFPEEFKLMLMKPYFNDLTLMQYVRTRRNDLAHGIITFENGADKKTHAELDYIAKLTLEFLEIVTNSCNEYVLKKGFLKKTVT